MLAPKIIFITTQIRQAGKIGLRGANRREKGSGWSKAPYECTSHPLQILAQFNNLFGSDIFIIEKSCVMAYVDEIFWNYCELIKSVF